MTGELLDLDDLRRMERNALSKMLNEPQIVVVKYNDVKLKKQLKAYRGKGANGKDKLAFFGNTKDPDFASRQPDNDVLITNNDIAYLTDYEHNKTLIDEITGRKDLSFNRFTAWVNNYNIYVKTDGKKFYLPIVKCFRDGYFTYREMLASELFKYGRERVDEIEQLKSVARNIDGYYNDRQRLGTFSDLSMSDKNEWKKIIDHHHDQRYCALRKSYDVQREHRGNFFDGLPYDTAYYKGKEIKNQDITINLYFAMYGLPRINYVGGKLYIDGKETDKDKYFADNLDF